jgi:hypothetical protein
VAGEANDGWVEIWPTPGTLTQLDKIGATLEAIAPAELVHRPDGSTGLRMPVASAQGDPSLTDPARAHGSGALAGGILIHKADGDVRFTDLTGTVGGEQLSGHCTANDEDQTLQPALTWRSADVHATIVPGQPGEPLTVRTSELPVRPSQEAVDAFTRALGAPIFTTDTVLANITAQGHYLNLLQ